MGDDNNNNNNNFDEIVKTYFDLNANAHHSVAFNRLVTEHIPSIVSTYGKLVTLLNNVKYYVALTNVRVQPDEATPAECHQFGLNFCFAITGKISLRVVPQKRVEGKGQPVPVNPDWEKRPVKKIPLLIARVPCFTGRNVMSSPLQTDTMVNYPLDHGATINKGKPRSIPPVKSINPNVPIYIHKKNMSTLQIRSAHTDKVFRSTSTIEFIIDKNVKRSSNLGVIYSKLPFQATKIHLAIVVLALGSNIEEFIELVTAFAGKHFKLHQFQVFFTSLRHHKNSATVVDQATATAFIAKCYGKTIRSSGRGIIKNEILPHLRHPNKEQEENQKTVFLAMIITRLIRFHLGQVKETDRDSFNVTHGVASAYNLGGLFRMLFIAHLRTFGKLLRRALMKSNQDNLVEINLPELFGEHRLSSRVISAVASGIWSTQRKGVSIALNTNNVDSINMQLRRISSSLSTTDGSHIQPRSVSMSQYGLVCAGYTPDGEGTGLVYEMAMTAMPTPPLLTIATYDVLTLIVTPDLITPITKKSISLGPKQRYLSFNGLVEYIVMDVEEFVARVRTARRNHDINPFISVAIGQKRNSVTVWCREGIYVRPLIIASEVKRLTPTMSFKEAVETGIIEYLQASEMNVFDCKIAVSLRSLTPDCTHIEMLQVALLGRQAGSVSFVTSQQGPRLAYFASQRKQVITSDPRHHMLSSIIRYNLTNTHSQLVKAKTAQLDNTTDLRGTPLVTAFFPAQSAQEDAIVLNKSAIDRGALMASTTRIYVAETSNKNFNATETFEKPNKVLAKKDVSYDAILSHGLPAVGTYVKGGSVIIGRTKRTTKTIGVRSKHVATTTRDTSIVSRGDESGIVTSSTIATLPSGRRAQVEITTERKVTVGDKLTTQFSQKGVVGRIVPSVDMPFSAETGCAPDVIVSHISINSRMTMGSPAEGLAGKSVAVSGIPSVGIDNQQFDISNKVQLKKFGDLLKANGFNHNGTERYMSGTTGKPIPVPIFTGIITYYRLVHIASKKLHARSSGPRDALTRGPKDGRRFGGGLRSGEMELSAMAAHGVSRVLQTRFRELSDAFLLFVCSKCGIANDYSNETLGFHWCDKCATRDHIVMVIIPFTLRILLLELLATGIVVKLKVVEDKESAELRCIEILE